MFKVTHRQDQLLQRSALVEGGPLPETRAAHRALLAFLDERLVGREFASLDEIKGVLGAWQAPPSRYVDSFWSRLCIREAHSDDWPEEPLTVVGILCTEEEGLGGPFCFGMVVAS